ncbi:hypothetical protein ACMA1I_02965 [Pontibacter sp. 13R65]|uniref:hypothetical protein n=1 Tax=Pontibacter sp. 13R65 TaxID=3127458 RepID=UPI00301C7FEE
MDKTFKNIFVGVSPDTTLELIENNDINKFTLAITVPLEVEQLERVYKKLAVNRGSKMILVLPSDCGALSEVANLTRFFFLSGYCFINNSPILAFTGTKCLQFCELLVDWCLNQGYDNPVFIEVSNFGNNNYSEEKLINVPHHLQDEFLLTFHERTISMEWFSYKFILQINNKKEFYSFNNFIENFSTSLLKEYPGVLSILNKIGKLEDQLHLFETVVRFQEIEIKNHILYNNLIRGVVPVNQTVTLQQSLAVNSSNEVEKLKNDCNRLFLEIGNLRNDLAWYRRTYEERSILGVVKDKVLSGTPLKNFVQKGKSKIL